MNRLSSAVWLLVVVAWAGPGTARAATIHGTVRAEAPPEVAREGAGSGRYDSRRLKFAERIDYSQLRDFVVFIDQPVTNAPGPPAKPVRIVTQKDAVFKPHVLPIVVGTTIEWPNEDDIFHNVFSMSSGNDFELGLYKEAGPDGWPTFTFRKPGRVDVFCSIHSKMNCVILVLENPYFGVSDAKGRFTINSVPPGRYQLKAWHERLPSRSREITVPDTGELKIDFVLGPGGASQAGNISR